MASFRRLCAAAGASLALAGCATVESTADKLASTKVCCASFAELPVRKAERDQVLEVEFDASLPAYDFAEGRSYFVALAVPQGAPATLQFTTAMNGIWLPSATVLMPAFLFLDANRKPLGSPEQPPVQQAWKPFEPSFSSSSWGGEVNVPPGAAFVVVYALASRFGQTVAHTKRDSGYMFMAGATPIFVPGGSTPIVHRIPYVGTGSLKVRIR